MEVRKKYLTDEQEEWVNCSVRFQSRNSLHRIDNYLAHPHVETFSNINLIFFLQTQIFASAYGPEDNKNS